MLGRGIVELKVENVLFLDLRGIGFILFLLDCKESVESKCFCWLFLIIFFFFGLGD